MLRKTLFMFLGTLAFTTPACGDSGGDDTAATTGSPTGETPATSGSPTSADTSDTGGTPTTGGTTTGGTTTVETTNNEETTTTEATTTTGDVSTTGSATDCNTDICAIYGAAVPKVASDITDQAAADPMFMADFAPLVAEGPAAVDAFKTSLTNFITDAYGCTAGAYTGPSMEEAHTGLGITQPEYDAFIGLIAGVLASNGVTEDDILYCFAPPLVDPAFAGTIIGK